MKPPYPSLTSEWHDNTYPAIDPKRPELSAKGKTIVISGGGSGIGRGIAQAFALAGASAIAILGRRQASLEETKQLIASKLPGTTVSTHVADVTDSLAVQKAAREIGQWDVLVSNAGYLSSKAPLMESNEAEWWKGFEINVKGSYNLTKTFMPSRNPDSTIISVNAGSIQVPGPFSAGFSSYNSSKFAVLKMFEILAVENPDVHVVSMHPGVVDTEMKRRNDMPSPHMDAVELPSHFAVWLCSQEAKFLRGKFVWSNWDVEEIIANRVEIESSLLLTANCIGWPFTT
ncbi:hypothetical protein LTR91_021050 [Friedmanniomyces endolithicus]|uniref:Uncharacterized protein n=1 Tax=Friedmanniomyces endolithicus TaxID=329885 RepID=A0AAN6H7K9_9PEZI|nr:hypothetical protein LTR38_009707 [Friedmanniomyces endolithicus]KAK0812286.1 hypothetical protein LTR75_005052 [Friedmanniomyces endolithicus]KAK0841317.1 hypothetical protein LTR03_009977 [Friedmanniomyces endolithicus]KAK0844229.1 hypothetical protein LTS02_015805 [Friedmanniomyces endolithicus]KAK0880648.1 hypothetical protein LTR87_005457 [Friedmanniomyces endolithicus]